jgi:hypothetical protein
VEALRNPLGRRAAVVAMTIATTIAMTTTAARIEMVLAHVVRPSSIPATTTWRFKLGVGTQFAEAL